MITVVETSPSGSYEIITNGNYSYWVRPTKGAFRDRYRTFAGKSIETAKVMLNAMESLYAS